MPYEHFLPDIVVIAGALFALGITAVWPKRAGFASYSVALLTMFTSCGLALLQVPEGADWGGMLVSDGFSRFFKVVLTGGAGLIWISAWPYLRERIGGKSEFSFLFLTSLFGLMLLTSVTNFLMFVVALETASLGMYVLAASMRNEKTSLEAGIKFFINSAFATAIMLWGISILFGVTGSLDFSSVASGLFQYIGDEIKPFPMLGILALLVGLGFKITLFPFHLWAPDVYEGSPTPFTAFLATISKAAGIAVLIRIFAVPINDLVPDFNGLLWILSAFTMLAASSTALWQSSAKRLLAYSSISHAGFILMGIAAFGTVEDALLASVFYIPAYVLATVGAFGVLTSLERRYGDTSIKVFNGLWRTNPLLTIAMVVFLASLVGLPPTYGFMGKYMLFAKAYEGGLNILLASAVVATLISLFFYFRIVRCMLLNEPNDPHEATTEFTPLLSIPAAMFRRFFVAPEIDLGSSDDNLRPHSAGFSFFMFVLCLLLLLALFFWTPLYDSAVRAIEGISIAKF